MNREQRGGRVCTVRNVEMDTSTDWEGRAGNAQGGNRLYARDFYIPKSLKIP